MPSSSWPGRSYNAGVRGRNRWWTAKIPPVMPWSWPDLPHRLWRGGGPPWRPSPGRPPRSPGCCWVEVMGSPRVRAAALGLARSLAGWLAGRRLPASAGLEATTRQVTVVKHADTSVLVHRVETALVVRTLGVAPGWLTDDEQRPGSKGATAVSERPCRWPR